MNISLEEILAVQKMMDEAEIPPPNFIWLKGMPYPVSIENYWLIWLFSLEYYRGD